MIQQIQGPTGPASPQGPQPVHGAQAPPPIFDQSAGGVSKAMSPWAKMFGGMATEKELKQIMNLVIKGVLDQMKKEQAKALETIKKMRREQEEGMS